MSKKLKVAIIGNGRIYPMHADAISHLEQAEMVAHCDIILERAEQAAAKYGGKAYQHYQDIDDVDVVHLCLPHGLHYEVGKHFAEKGIHVFTEKPIDVSSEKGQALIDVCEKNNVKFGVVFQNRFRKTNQYVKQLVENKTYGSVKGAKMSLTWDRSEDYYASTGWKGTWELEGGGVIIDQAIHTLDFLNWVLGGNIESIDARVSNRNHPHIEVEDTAEGIISYQEGFKLLFYASNNYSYDAEVEAEIHCENAVLRMYGPTLYIYHANKEVEVIDIDHQAEAQHAHEEKAYWGTTHVDQIKEFHDYLLGNRDDILVTGAEALKTMKLVEGIYRSSTIQRKINF